MSSTSIAWFRRDLRLHDNPAWAAATAADTTVALFVIEPRLFDRAGPFRRNALLHALTRLDRELAAVGGRLRVERGRPDEVLAAVATQTGAHEVHANADVTRWSQRRDSACEQALRIPLNRHWGTLVQPPGSVLTKAGTLSKVFTPFHRAWLEVPVAPEAVARTTAVAATLGIGVPEPDGAAPPATGAVLDHAGAAAEHYLDRRDTPGVRGTSELSIALKFGLVSARHVVRTLARRGPGADALIRQLAWRDWYAHITNVRPDIDRHALRPEYDAIAWESGPDADRAFDAWRTGRTGFPIVDAGMRQLAATGWMHNRVRMISASFLVKDLLIDWRRGERWFRHLLADGDIPQNAGNWQWIAGTGPDAAPYFRIFNPTTQSRRFDPSGDYIRRWVPELAGVDNRAIHEPSAAPPLDLAAAGITLGTDYPYPVVDHAVAREETLDVYRRAIESAREK